MTDSTTNRVPAKVSESAMALLRDRAYEIRKQTGRVVTLGSLGETSLAKSAIKLRFGFPVISRKVDSMAAAIRHAGEDDNGARIKKSEVASPPSSTMVIEVNQPGGVTASGGLRLSAVMDWIIIIFLRCLSGFASPLQGFPVATGPSQEYSWGMALRFEVHVFEAELRGHQVYVLPSVLRGILASKELLESIPEHPGLRLQIEVQAEAEVILAKQRKRLELLQRRLPPSLGHDG